MADQIKHTVNSEVFRLVREKIKVEDQEKFLTTLISYMRRIPKELRMSFVRFVVKSIEDMKVDIPALYNLWSDAAAKETHDRKILGPDY